MDAKEAKAVVIGNEIDNQNIMEDRKLECV